MCNILCLLLPTTAGHAHHTSVWSNQAHCFSLVWGCCYYVDLYRVHTEAWLRYPFGLTTRQSCSFLCPLSQHQLSSCCNDRSKHGRNATCCKQHPPSRSSAWLLLKHYTLAVSGCVRMCAHVQPEEGMRDSARLNAVAGPWVRLQCVDIAKARLFTWSISVLHPAGSVDFACWPGKWCCSQHAHSLLTCLCSCQHGMLQGDLSTPWA